MIKKFNLKLIVFLIACLYSTVLSAQINSSTAVVPFGANPSYGNGIMPTNLPSGGAYGKSQDAADAYTEWRNNYTESCGGGMYRVKFDEPNRTVSEGIGYGMQLAAYAADKTLFDGLYTYWKNFKSPASAGKTGKLMNWRIEGCGPTVSGTGSAADADVDAAWALLIAENQWPTATSPFDYGSEATNMLYSIKELELNSAGQLINGDGWGFGDNCRNPGYQSPAYYPFFATNNTFYSGSWTGAITSAYTLLNANADGTTGLISDWSNPSGARNTCNPGGLGYAATDGYGYDACRNPWRMAQDVIWNNSTSGKSYCGKIANYLTTRGSTGNVGGPLYQNGTNYSGYAHNATFVATFATAVMGSTNQTLMNSMYTETKNTKDVIKNSTLSGYFGNTLRCVALFMMSGNYWKPGTSSLQEINVRQGTKNYLNASTYDFQNQQTTPPAVSGKTATFTIENLGFATLTLSGSPRVVLGGTNANQFSIVQPTAASLALGATTTFDVTFTPTTTGAKTATLTIASNDPDENPYVITLIGTGTANITSPKISVFDAETKTAVSNNGTVAMGTSSIGSADVRRLGIVNTGDAALNLTHVIAGTGYTLVTVPAAPSIVAINDTAYVYVQVTSAAAGTPAGSLTMTSNDNINPSFKVNFTSNFVACGTAVTANEVYQDFEGNYKNTTLAYTFSGYTELVDNTHIDAKNPSPKVAQLNRSGAGYQGPRYILCGTGTVNLTAAKFVVSMLIYSPASGVPVQMNLKTDADVANTSTYPSRSSVTINTTKANQWERLYFNHTGAIGTAGITNIEIYIEPTAVTPTPVLPTTATYLIDDIRLDAAPCLTDNSGVIQDFDDHNNSTLAYGVTGYIPGAPTAGRTTPLPAIPAVAGGLNTSANAGYFVKSAATAAYGDGLRYVGCGGKMDFSTKKYVSMLVYSSVANAKINMSPKIGATDVLAATPTTQTVFANKWHRVYFDLSAIPAASLPNITGLDIFFDPLNSLGAQTYWFDDLRYESAPPCVAGIDATDILNDFEDNRYLDIAFPGAVPVAPSVTYFNTVNTNPSATGVNTSPVVGKFVRGLATDGTSFRFTACQSKLDLSPGHNIIEFKVYSPNANVPVVMSLKNVSGTTLANVTDTVKVANAWTTLRYDFTQLLNATNVASVDVVVDPNALFSGASSTAAARTYYVDDLKYALPSPEINIQALTAPTATDIPSKGAFNMGTAAVGDSTLMNFNIQNNGLQTLTLTGTGIASVVVGGANAADFIVSASPSFSTSIGAFGAAGFTVKFKPTAAGARSASLTIVSNDANEGTYVIYLNGTATVPIIKVLDGGTALSPVIASNNTPAINIGTSAVGVASTPAYTMSIKNTGVAPLKITSITASAGFTLTPLTPTGDILTGAIATFTITGTPATTGLNAGTITVVSNDPATPSYKVNITVTGSVPVITVQDATATLVVNNNTTPVSVGTAPVTTAATPAYTFTIKNTGSGPLTITSVTPTTGFTVTAVTPTGAIAANGSATFTVTGTPAAAGVNLGSITIASNDPVTGSYKVNVSVTGTVPALQVLNGAAIVTTNNTPAISVGTATVAQPATAYTSFSIKNTGSGPLTLTSIVGSTGFAVSAVTPTTPATIAASGTATFTVTGTPALVGANLGTITITTNDPTTPSFKINVSVTGNPAATPALQVLNGATILTTNGTAISVGSAVVANPATPFTTFSIKNAGTAALTFTSITGSTGFAVTAVTPAAPTTIAASGTATFTVTGTPAALGANAGTITIVTNDPTTPTFVINVTVTGTAAPVPALQVFNSTTLLTNNATPAISVGTAPITTPATAYTSFSITNNGTAALSLTSITGSTGFAVSAITPTAPASIAAGGTATFTVTGTPALAGANAGTITIATNDPTTPSFVINVSVTGTVAPKLQVLNAATVLTNNATPATSVGSSAVSTPATAYTSFSIKNTGTSALTFTSVTGSTGFAVSAVSPAAPTTLAVNGTATFTVTGTPATLGTNTGTITIVTNDPTTASFVINVAVTGIAASTPAVQVLNTTAILTNNATPAISVGSAPTGTPAAAYTSFSVKNVGTAALALTSVTGSAGFAVTAVTPATPGSIAIGASATFTVTGTPAANGANTGTITIVTDDPTTPSFVINVSVTGTVPALVVLNSSTAVTSNNSPAISVGSAAVGSPATAYTSLSIKNNGTGPLTLTSILGSAGFAVTAVTPTTPATIAPSGTATFTVTGTPAALGANAGTITIATNDPTTSSFVVNVTVLGTPPPTPAVQVKNGTAILTTNNAPAISVGAAVTGSPATAYTSFSIQNIGTAALTLTSITGSTGFAVSAVTPTTPATIAPNGTATFTVTGTPAALGINNGTITISTNDPTTGTFVVNVTVTGTLPPAPALQVKNGSAILTTNSTAISVGTAVVNTQGNAYTSFSIQNTGNAPLSLTSIVGSAGFAISAVTPTTPATIAANGTATFTVRGTPSVVGANAGTITITTNDPTTSSFVINVTVTGTAAPQATVTVPGVTNNGPAVSIGTAVVGNPTAPYTFNILNSGTLPLNVGTITSSNPDFVVTQVSPATIAPGSSGTFTVTATPSSIGTSNGVISIPSNDPGGVFKINVTATGTTAPTGPAIQVKGKSNQIVGNNSSFIIGANTINTPTAPYTFTITNIGGAPLTITNISTLTGFSAVPPSPNTIAPGASATFTVTGIPNNASATRYGTVTIFSNDPLTPTFTINAGVNVGTPTGVRALSSTEIEVFPNPTTLGYSNIEFNGSFDDVVVTVYSADGSRAMVKEFASAVEETKRLDVQELPSGVYFVEVTTAQGTIMKRLIKQ